jgi:pimeloyl-ACP methyl ester carboxylesterase
VALCLFPSDTIREKGKFMTTKFISANGIQLAYDEAGQGEKTLLLLHGITANRQSFNGLMRAGIAKKYRVLRLDLRGRGESAMPAQGYHMRDHAADILEMLDKLGLEKVNLVGHSFGGLLSVFMASHTPERLDKIVIMDAAREATTQATVEKIRPSLERLKLSIPDVDAAINSAKSMPYFADGSWSEEIENWYRSELEPNPAGGYRRRIHAEGIMEAVDHILAEDWFAHFKGVKVPALLIHAPAPFGAAGAPSIVSQAGAEETLSLIPNCQYKQVSGHHITMLFGDNAPQIVDAITEFVK